MAAVTKYDGEITPSELLVFLFLANYANQTNQSCFPSQDFLAKVTRLSERTVRAALVSLEGKRLISRTPRRNPVTGQALSDVITVEITLAPSQIRQRQELPVGPDANRQNATSQPATVAGEPIKEPSKTPPTPKGDMACKADIEAVWSITPLPSQQRSSQADVGRALAAAYKRKRSLEEVLAGLRGYFTSREAKRDDGAFLKGVHRMITNDRYAAFSGRAPVHRLAEASPWPRRLASWVSRLDWDDTGWGPRPNEAGCRAPPEMVAEAVAERAVVRARLLAKVQA